MTGRRPRSSTVRLMPAAPVTPVRVAAGPGLPATRGSPPVAAPAPRPARRRLRIRWGRLVAFILGVYLAAGFVSQQLAYWEAQREIRALEAEMRRVEAENRSLRERAGYVQGDAYINEAARERLGLVREGETVIQLVDPGDSGQGSER